jgi:hypothetical protein
MRTGIADLPLHYGKAPRWLMEKMISLSGYILEAIISEKGIDFLLEKLSDPFWFQSLGNFLGFDWHSSGLTTTLCASLKEAIKGKEKEFGLFIVGGKGRTSLKTPDEIKKHAQKFGFEPNFFIKASKISAKVDNVCLQDGYNLYHHTFIFTPYGEWVVIQQGMNSSTHYARRYHWKGNRSKDFIVEPHSGIISIKKNKVIDLTSKISEQTRDKIIEICKENPDKNVKELKKIKKLKLPQEFNFYNYENLNLKRFESILFKIKERNPSQFVSLINIEGLGAKTLRALTLLSHLLYGSVPNFKDPAKYSFAHGGKDGIPYKIDRVGYQNTIKHLKEFLHKADVESKMDLKEFLNIGI